MSMENIHGKPTNDMPLCKELLQIFTRGRFSIFNACLVAASDPKIVWIPDIPSLFLSTSFTTGPKIPKMQI